MKILCVCEGGNCRSATLAYRLKYYHGHDALACGLAGNSRDTLNMLCAWAQRIIVVEAHYKTLVPTIWHHKTVVYDIGPDKWFAPNVQLLQLLDEYIEQDMVVMETRKNSLPGIF